MSTKRVATEDGSGVSRAAGAAASPVPPASWKGRVGTASRAGQCGDRWCKGRKLAFALGHLSALEGMWLCQFYYFFGGKNDRTPV